MIIVDKALEERERQGNPIKVGLVGAGYMGRGIAHQIEKYIKGMKVVAIYNRTIAKAEQAYRESGINSFGIENSIPKLEDAISDNRYSIIEDPSIICQAENIDAVIDATGEIEFGAKVALQAIENKKHIILMGAELDALLGPILKIYTDQAGVVFTNTDGDQPGVIMNLLRFVETIGYKPVLAGNIKGLQDYYRTPETQRSFAEQAGITPKMATAFADGTKISMEMAIVANATGFKVGQRGMYGPRCSHANEAIDFFPKEKLLEEGLVDFILGAEPGPGVFVIGYNENPIRKGYMKYFKMGDGPFYTFYVPYHLPHLEAPLTVARAVIFGDAAITPLGKPMVDVVCTAKTDLQAGAKLDGIGQYMTYGLCENAEVAINENYLPIGLAEGCTLKNDISKDTILKYDDVEIPIGRLADSLRDEQNKHFYSLPSIQE